MARIKVVHLINSLKPGGAERFLVDLARHLPRTDFDVRILCLYKKGEFTIDLEEAGIEVVDLEMPHRFSWMGYKKLYQTLHGESIDILHCHLLTSCWYGLPVGWIVGIPVRIAHLQNCYWHLRLKLRLFDRLTFQFANAAFGCSSAVLDFYRKRMWYPPSKMHLVYNAVDPSRFENLPKKEDAKRKLGLNEGEIVLTTVASLTPQKGHKYLLQAAKEIVAHHRNVKFLIVGEGGLRPALEEQANVLGIKSWVRFLGKRMDVPDILAGSDLFVLPSLWEGLPLVLVEAGLAAVPVVASRVDGVPEIVQDGRNGLLVAPGDAHSLARACLQLIEDPQLREKMGKEGKIIALEHFDIKQIAAKVAKLYHMLLERTKQ